MPAVTSPWQPYRFTKDNEFIYLEGRKPLEPLGTVSSIRCSVIIRVEGEQEPLFECNGKVVNLQGFPPMTRWRMPGYVLSHPNPEVQAKLEEMKGLPLEIRAVFNRIVAQ